MPGGRIGLVAIFVGALCGCAGGDDATASNNGGAGGGKGGHGGGGISGNGGWATGGTSSGGGGSGGVSGGGGSAGAPLACDPGFQFSKNPATAGVAFQASYTNGIGYTYIGLHVTGPGSPTTSNLQITGSGPYTWTYTVSGHGEGILAFTFVEGENNGNPGNPVASCQIYSVAAGGTGGGGGTGGTGGSPQGFVTSNGTSFARDGKDYRFVGANVRGITHYGHGDALPYADGAQIELNLSSLQSMGGKVIRAFVAYQGIDAQATGDRLQTVLDAMKGHNQTMVVVLTDFYSTPFHPKGDDGFYASDLNGYTVLNHDFFASGYQSNYKPLVQALVSRFKDHPAILAWELGNEIRDATFSNSNPDTFIAFTADMSGAIRAIDKNHLISVGEISALNNGMSQQQAQTLYSNPNISFLTMRSYDGGSTDDTGFAASLGKPIIVEEAGYQSGDRPSELSGDLGKWFGKGARGYLQWGFVAASTDNGDGDKQFGMDKIWHSDWSGLYSSYQSFAAGL